MSRRDRWTSTVRRSISPTCVITKPHEKPMSRRCPGVFTTSLFGCTRSGNSLRFGIIGRRVRWLRIRVGASITSWRRPPWRKNVCVSRWMWSHAEPRIPPITLFFGPNSLRYEVRDGPAERKVSLQPDERRACYAACRVVEVERVLPNRFCWINGSSTSPQLIHRRTVPSVENSGLDSSIINPLHF